jgi:hypothetical protein
VVVDGRSRDGFYRAKSEYYFDVGFASPEKFEPGQAVRVVDWQLLG